MTKVVWDQVGQRLYETGVDHGVLYIPDGSGVYNDGFAWNGLTSVSETPSGADSNKQYADNQVYVNILSLEQFGGTIKAFTYPDEFAQCDGTEMPQPGIAVGQQARKSFGLSYRTRLGNDIDGSDYGYKLHLVYGAQASPSQRQYDTINDSPAPIEFSWDFQTVPVVVGTVGGHAYKPTSIMTITSTLVDSTVLSALEDLLYGTVGTDPSLPLPADVLGMFAGTITDVFPTAPTYNNSTHTLTIPSVTGVSYYIGPDLQTAGSHSVTQDIVVTARADVGYRLQQPSVDEWFIDYS